MNSAVRTAEQKQNRPAAGWTQNAIGHLPEYACEAAGLGLFMLSACVFGVLLGHPMSRLYQGIDSALLRRIVTGIAMGLTAVAIIRSPLGQRSGAHLNPAFTISWWLLGKVRPIDAVFYVVAQILGGLAGVLLAEFLIGTPLSDMAVNYVVTKPGDTGPWVAFAGELGISFLMMTTVLAVSNQRSLSRYTPWFAGFLIANFIAWESPYSGMSMNPARTLGSALPASDWTAVWIYFTAPPAAMLAAAILYRWLAGNRRIYCAKLHHHNNKRCIFNCRFGEM